MNFRNYAQLSIAIKKLAQSLPADIQLIVGIPRSGLLAASLLALFKNCQLTDLDQFLAQKVIQGGARLRDTTLSNSATVLILDDSISTGAEMSRVRKLVASRQIPQTILYGAVFATQKTARLVDVYAELLEQPRVFEWNFMHHKLLANACVDFDGVLCNDPTTAENDDGKEYRKFLAEAKPLYQPTREIGWIVTSRLEKYRAETVQWLKDYSIHYRELRMLQLPTAEERRRLNCHAQFKAEQFIQTGASWFIESNAKQAAEICQKSGKDVIELENMQLISSSEPEKLNTYLRRKKTEVKQATIKKIKDIHRKYRVKLVS
jgi:uncharacterized HAD superfamily protein